MSTFKIRIVVKAMIAAVVLADPAIPVAVSAAPPASPTTSAADLYGDTLPSGALARLGTVRFRGSNGQLHGLAFLPDGKTLVAVDGESIIRFWETSSGRRLRQIAVGPFYVNAVAFSSDGKQIAISGTKRDAAGHGGFEYVIRILEMASGKEVWSLERGENGAHALAFTPDGKYLFSFGGGILRIDEIASGTELLQQKFPRDISVNSLVLSPDGKTAAVWSGPNSRKLYLWDWQGAEGPRELKVPGRGAYWLCFSPDGKTLAGSDQLGLEVYLWDAASGQLQRRRQVGADATIGGLAFHPDGKSLAVADTGSRVSKHGNGGALIMDLQSGKIVRELRFPGTSAVRPTFSADGRWLAALGGGGVRVWDLRSGEAVAACSAGHQGMIAQIAADKNGQVATASDDHTVRIWDAATGKERANLPHGNWVRAVALSPDGRLLVSSSLDDFVHLWDAQTGKEIYKLVGHGRLGGYRSVGFLPDSRRFLSFGDDFYLRIWDSKTGKAIEENRVRPPGIAIPDDDDDKNERGAAMRRERFLMLMGPSAFTPDGKRLVLAIHGAFHIINAATGHGEHRLENPGGHVLSVAVSPDSRLFAVSAWGRMLQTKLPDGRTRISTPNYHLVCVVEVATGKLVKKLEMPTTNAGPVAFSADSKLLAVGFGRDGGEIRLLDVTNGETSAVLTRFGSPAHALTFSRDGKYLIAGLQDTTALVWDLKRLLAKSARKENSP